MYRDKNILDPKKNSDDKHYVVMISRRKKNTTYIVSKWSHNY